MAHAQLLNSMNDSANLNRKQPLHIELNGRQLTLDEYNRLIRLSKHQTTQQHQQQQPSSLSSLQQKNYTTPTPTTVAATTSATKLATKAVALQHSPPQESSNEDANGVGGRGKTINTITIKTVCTSAKPIQNSHESSSSSPSTTTTTTTTTNVTTAVPGADGGHLAGVRIGATDGAIGDQFSRNQQFQRESSVRSQSSSQPLSKPPLSTVRTNPTTNVNNQTSVQHKSQNGRIPFHSSNVQSSPTTRPRTTDRSSKTSLFSSPSVTSSSPIITTSENGLATKHSVEVTRETLRETTHRIPVDQLTDEQMHSAGLLQYQTQPFRVSTAVTSNNSTNYGSQARTTSTSMAGGGGGGGGDTLGRRSRQHTDRREPAYFESTHQNDQENADQSLVSSGHVQQQINQLSARLQTQPQLEKSYQRLVHQQHSLLTSSNGTGNDQQSREVVTQQLRYTDDWNRPPVSERHLERTVERKLPNGSIDRQVNRQMERNLLTSPDDQSFVSSSTLGNQTLPHRFAGGSGRPRQRLRSKDELDSDQFVQELRTRIANGSQSTSSPNVASGRSATLDRKWTSNKAYPGESGMMDYSRDFSSSTSQLKSGDRSRSADRRRPLSSTVTAANATPISGGGGGSLSKSSNVIGSPGGSLASPIRTSVSHEKQQLSGDHDADDDHRFQLRPEDYAHLSSQLPSARFSYACSRNVNGYPESGGMKGGAGSAGGGGGDESGSDHSPHERINQTGDSSRFSDETLDVSKRSIEFDADSSNSFRKRDKYGFFVDQEPQPESSQRKLPMEVVRRREKKWLVMLKNWDRFMQNKWVKIRDRCRKGIPESVRGLAWFHLCAAHKHRNKNPNLFAMLAQQPGDETINEEIRRDLHRQFPTHEMFADQHSAGQQDLFKILKSFSIVKPDMGYSQGQAPLAAVLLMHLPAEQAFWTLLQLSDHYLPGYFGHQLDSLQIHGQMLHAFLKRFSPQVYKILKRQRIEPIFYMTEWFMCAFSRTLPWSTVLRVLDMFFCEGIRVIFRVALVILRSLEEDFEKANCRKGDKQGEVLALLKNIPKQYLTEEYLIPRVIALDLTEKDLQNEHNIQLIKRKKEKKEQNKGK